jgi:hypothetical protein
VSEIDDITGEAAALAALVADAIGKWRQGRGPRRTAREERREQRRIASAVIARERQRKVLELEQTRLDVERRILSHQQVMLAQIGRPEAERTPERRLLLERDQIATYIKEVPGLDRLERTWAQMALRHAHRSPTHAWVAEWCERRRQHDLDTWQRLTFPRRKAAVEPLREQVSRYDQCRRDRDQVATEARGVYDDAAARLRTRIQHQALARGTKTEEWVARALDAIDERWTPQVRATETVRTVTRQAAAELGEQRPNWLLHPIERARHEVRVDNAKFRAAERHRLQLAAAAATPAADDMDDMVLSDPVRQVEQTAAATNTRTRVHAGVPIEPSTANEAARHHVTTRDLRPRDRIVSGSDQGLVVQEAPYAERDDNFGLDQVIVPMTTGREWVVGGGWDHSFVVERARAQVGRVDNGHGVVNTNGHGDPNPTSSGRTGQDIADKMRAQRAALEASWAEQWDKQRETWRTEHGLTATDKPVVRARTHR